MRYSCPDPRTIITAILLCGCFTSHAQTSFTDKIAEWKTTFPKEEVVATLFK
jgi:hypothetical protein